MTPGDFDTFLAEFSRLSAALGRYKTTPQEMNAKSAVVDGMATTAEAVSCSATRNTGIS